MPSWPVRFLSSSNAPSSSTPTSSTRSSPANYDRPLPRPPPRSRSGQTRIPPAEPEDLGGVPVPIRSDTSARPHSRSISHSLGIFRKKSTGRSAGNLGIDSSSDDDLASGPEDLSSSSPTKKAVGSSGKAKVEEQETTVAHCMTCDSSVHISKGTITYKCPICIAVNDLQPRLWEPIQKELQERPGTSSDAKPALAPKRKALPISNERTAMIIDKCITIYLENRGKQRRPSQVGSPRLPFKASNATISASVDTKGPRSTGNAPVFSASPPSATTLSGLPRAPSSTVSSSQRKPIPKHSQKSFSESLQSDDIVTNASSFSVFPAKPARNPPPPPISFPNVPSQPRREIVTTPPEGQNRPLEGSPKILADSTVRPAKAIFKELEDYIIHNFGRFDCLNTSFSTIRPIQKRRTQSESSIKIPPQRGPMEDTNGVDITTPGIDAKTLLLGDFAENGAWWSGREEDGQVKDADGNPQSSSRRGRMVNSKSPLINWQELSDWYEMILHASRGWKEKSQELQASGVSNPLAKDMYLVERELREAQHHVERVLLKVTESLLRRPSRPLKKPEHLRFLLVLLANPLLYPPESGLSSTSNSYESRKLFSGGGKAQGQHPGIVKRILGLLAGTPPECHRICAAWFSRYSEDRLQRTIELVGRFVTYRLSRQNDRKRTPTQDMDDGLVPDITASNADTSAQLHAALGLSRSTTTATTAKKGQQPATTDVLYSEDWQLRAAAKVMALLFAANNSYYTRKANPINVPLAEAAPVSSGVAARLRAKTHGQLVPTSDFYNTLLDYMNLVADFELWETRRAKFCFCQYPFFLSIGAKIRILEHDARRQMEIKAREAFFNAIMTESNSVGHYFLLKVRRDCLVEDSLQQISAAVGSSDNEVKKGLRVQFVGEEGVDVGGLRKEWFLMLIREIFDPNHGLFLYDDDSKFCYFNPFSFETSAQYFLVGVAIGLAIYNSTILDVALPPFTFKKLLASAPPSITNMNPNRAPLITYTLEDLAEYRPALASGLQALLDYPGTDVESTFALDFVATLDRYGSPETISLIPHGASTPVTHANRHAFVDAYVRHLLDTAVSRQFEPFKRGFFTVCGGNALSLFRPEEIELLVRGSDEPLDVAALRAVAVYDAWNDPRTNAPIPRPDADVGPPDDPRPAVPVVRWFWEAFERATPQDQRRLLGFVTGSDRIPATGAANLVIRVACAGQDEERYPTARTCFNRLGLQWYRRREALERKLWEAVRGSEGFGLK
ncbi:HECT-domain-containing protein [Viridothelium virens]|uniref:HECT-type E3 ubiquitin transferase n=1 Tax=Viridothelium virens TaxID=1048519 RepID=A0A6A6HLA1_VIRVR|nr:HECT-domain-containing protein [Viridothelium virens]